MAKAQIRFTNDHRAELAKILKAVGYRHGAWQIFRDFVAMGAIALSNATDPRYRVARDAEYMSIGSRPMGDGSSGFRGQKLSDNLHFPCLTLPCLALPCRVKCLIDKGKSSSNTNNLNIG